MPDLAAAAECGRAASRLRWWVVKREVGGAGWGGEEGSQEAVVLIVLCKRGPVHRGRTGFPRLRYGLPCRKGRDVPGVALAVKLHFKARAGETGVGAEPLPQERGQVQKPFSTGVNHLRHETGRTRPRWRSRGQPWSRAKSSGGGYAWAAGDCPRASPTDLLKSPWNEKASWTPSAATSSSCGCST